MYLDRSCRNRYWQRYFIEVSFAWVLLLHRTNTAVAHETVVKMRVVQLDSNVDRIERIKRVYKTVVKSFTISCHYIVLLLAWKEWRQVFCNLKWSTHDDNSITNIVYHNIGEKQIIKYIGWCESESQIKEKRDVLMNLEA